MSSSDVKVYCKHMEEAAKRTSHTSKHPNREFYCCNRAPGDPTKCDFWYWADNLPKDNIIHPLSSSSVSPAPRPSKGGKARPAAAPRTQHPTRTHPPTSNNSPVTPRSRKRLEDIHAGLRQREQDHGPTHLPGPSREPGPSILSSSAQDIDSTTTPPSPVPTEVDIEAEAQPRKTYSFLGLHYSPEPIVATIKNDDKDRPSTPKKQRLIPPSGDVEMQPAADPVTSGIELPLTPPQTTRRVTRSGEQKSISATTHSTKGKEREGRPPVETQDQNGYEQQDSPERGDSGELQEDSLPLFTLAGDVSTTSSASPTTAENVLDYTDGMKARVKALSGYMDSFDIIRAAKLLQTVERQKIQYECRDRSQKMRIEELVAENERLVAEVSRLEGELKRFEGGNGSDSIR